MSLLQATQGHSPEEVRRVLAEVLDDPRFEQQADSSNPIVDFLTWLFKNIDIDAPPQLLHVLAWVVGGILLVAALSLIVFLLLQLRSDGSTRKRLSELDAAEGQRRRRFRETLEQARAARASGALALATRLYLFALLLAHSERSTLVLRPSWTLREVLRRGAPPPALERELRQLIDEFEPVEYEQRAAQSEELAHLDQLCSALFPTAQGQRA